MTATIIPYLRFKARTEDGRDIWIVENTDHLMKKWEMQPIVVKGTVQLKNQGGRTDYIFRIDHDDN